MTLFRKSGLFAAVVTLVYGFIPSSAEESPSTPASSELENAASTEEVKADPQGTQSEKSEVTETAEAAEKAEADIPVEPTDPAAPQVVPEGDVVLPLIDIDTPVTTDPYWTPAPPPVELEVPTEESTLENVPLDEEAAATERQRLPFVANPAYHYPGTAPGNASYAFNGQPTGFNNAPVFLPPGNSDGEILRGFSFSTNISGTYSSNVTQASGRPGDPVLDDFIMGLGGTISYLSTARFWTFGGNYSGGYNQYFDNDDFSGVNQSAGLVANYDGAKLSASLTTGFSFGQGANRNYAASNFIEQTSINTNFSSRYAYSSKTAITADAGYTFTTASGGNFSDTSTFHLGMAALWRYSPLTEFGPGIRYTANYGGGNNDRTSIGPTLNVNYKLSTKVSMTSRVGLDFTSYSNGGSADPTTSALIGLNYNASSLWGMDLSLYRDAQADPSVPGAFNEVTSLRLGYHRKIRRATCNLGASYEFSSTENPNAVPGGGRPDRDYLTFDASLGMAIFANTTQASLFYRFSDRSGSAAESFDSSQLGFSLSRGF